MKRATVIIALICLMPLLILSVIYGPGIYHWMTKSGPKTSVAGLPQPALPTITPTPMTTSATPPAVGLPPPPVEGPTRPPEDVRGQEVKKPFTQERSENTVTVRAGDNLFNIVVKRYGDSTYMNDVLVANPGLNPKRLRIGQKIVLPPKEKLDRKSRTGAPKDEPQIYVVKEGDNLVSIATHQYADTAMADKIFDFNRDQLPTREALRPGMRLRLPPPPQY
jgi:nucleoid-associated protein YgaU